MMRRCSLGLFSGPSQYREPWPALWRPLYWRMPQRFLGHLSRAGLLVAAVVVFFGTASHADLGEVRLATPAGGSSTYTGLRGSLAFALGVGAELGVTLARGRSGALVLQATPLVLYGANGTALALPVGAAYRWQ